MMSLRNPIPSPCSTLPSRRRLTLAGVALALLGCSDGADCVDKTPPTADLAPVPAWIDPATYAAELRIDPRFPFAVRRRYTTARPLAGARWGSHGGPLLTSQVGDPAAQQLSVTRFTLPAAATGPLLDRDLAVTVAAGLPSRIFFGDMVDLPGADLSILSYSSSAAHFQGEVLLYGADYSAVRSRAFANGFYDVGGSVGGAIFSTGLSGLSATVEASEDNGLWRSELCAGAVVPSGRCAPSRKLFGWPGYSGPLTLDAQGNLFVAAALASSPPAPTDEIYAVAASAAATGTALVPATLLSLSASGTTSIAAVAPIAGQPGWLLHKGYNPPMQLATATAQPYAVTGEKLGKSGAALPAALTPGPAAIGYSLLTDPAGQLWVAIAKPDGSILLALERLP